MLERVTTKLQPEAAACAGDKYSECVFLAHSHEALLDHRLGDTPEACDICT